MEPFECTGLWWLPDSPSKQLAGTLVFTPENGLTLKLVGSWKELSALTQPDDKDLILGVAQGKIVTLYRCLDFGGTLSIPGTQMQNYRPGIAVLGRHYDSVDQLVFSKLSIQYPHLHEWVGVSGVALNQDSSGSFDLNYQRPVAIEATTPSAAFKFEVGYSINQTNRRHYAIKESATVTITPTGPLSLDRWFQAFITPMSNFLAFATGKSSAPTRLFSYQTDEEGKTKKIEVVYQTHNAVHEEDKSRPDILFKLGQIRPNVSSVLTKWLDLSRDLDSVINLFSGVIHHPELPLELQFLNLAHALESFHRRTHKNTVIPKADHRDRLELIVKSVPEKYRDWLRAKLAYSNEPTLSERVTVLLDKHGQAVKALIDDESSFLKLLRDTRNYLTHYDTGLARKAVQGKSLYHLTHQVRYLLLACLLTEIGIPLPTVTRLIEQNNDYQGHIQWYRENLAEDK